MQTAPRHQALSETATYDVESGELRVVIETPKESRNKYRYDTETGCLEFGFVLPAGMRFPFDFGFLPSTLGEDGDPLDVLVLMDDPVVPACVIRTRLIGAIEARQKAKGKDWERNDRLIAVASHAQTHADVRTLADLRPRLVEEIREFFVTYNRMREREFEPLGDAHPNRARELVEAGMKTFKERR